MAPKPENYHEEDLLVHPCLFSTKGGDAAIKRAALEILRHRQETVNKLLQLHFKDDKTRVSSDALLLVAELLKVFVREAAARGARQAEAEDLSRVEVEHVEKVLPQLLLDF